MNELTYFNEPALEFQFKQCTEDCRDGLTLFGPYTKASGSIRVGAIGTPFGVKYYSDFVERINAPIYTSSLGRPFYPGFQSIFGIEWPSNPAAVININQNEIDELLRIRNLQERTYKLVTYYITKIKEFLDNEEKAIDIWYLIIPYEIWLHCRPLSKTGRATYSKTQVDIYQSGQMSLFDDYNEDIGKYIEMYDSDSDFHDQLKARALQERISVPIQVIIEETLQFKNKTTKEEYPDDMKAHLAWTQSSTLYYKLGYLPWKLHNIRDGVCYVGLVFKRLQERTGIKKNYACSAAQMFLDSGDGIIFRGNNGPWLSRDEKTYHLDKTSAYQLLKLAVDSYKNNRGSYPRELFIHGRTKFTDEEWEGFNLAIAESSDTKLVGVTINNNAGLRLLRTTHGDKCDYGVLRGLAIIIDANSGYLWTKGYIPKTETTNHMEIARPLYITISRGEGDINTVMKDILALTKLNYNACIYADGLPVTLRFSDKIGDILTAIPNIDWPPKPFKYYI